MKIIGAKDTEIESITAKEKNSETEVDNDNYFQNLYGILGYHKIPRQSLAGTKLNGYIVEDIWISEIIVMAN